MKILFDARLHQNHMTGMSRYILNVLESLLLLDKENRYIVLINDKLSSDNIIFEIFKGFQNIEFYTTSISHMGPKNHIKMPKLIKKIAPDIYHYPHLDVPISRIPTVATIHDTAILHGIKKFKDIFGMKSFYIKYILKRSIIKSDRVIFISNSTKQEVISKLNFKDENKFDVVYNGIDEDFSIINFKEYDIFKKYSLPSKYILYVGMLRPHKNIERMISAIEQVNNDTKLVLVGKAYEGYNINLKSKHVVHINQVNEEDLKLLYKNALGFLFPSLIEGFGLPILESMSFGIPVITSNFGAMKEVARDCTLLVDPYDINDIVEKLEELFNDKELREILIEKGYQRVGDFSWMKTAQNVLDVYKDLYNEKYN